MIVEKEVIVKDVDFEIMNDLLNSNIVVIFTMLCLTWWLILK